MATRQVTEERIPQVRCLGEGNSCTIYVALAYPEVLEILFEVGIALTTDTQNCPVTARSSVH